jgi:diguanylate cyclase (GGDEF)-like protein
MHIASSRVQPLTFTAPVPAGVSGSGEVVPLWTGAEAIIATERVLLEQALARAEAAERRLAETGERIAQLEAMIQTDELTGLNNRRGFYDQFERELAGAQRSPSHDGIVVMCDLDGFKQINDSLGHAAGDAYLRQVGHTLRQCVRPFDGVARLGGDEFALLLIRTAAENGMRRYREVVERFHQSAAAWEGHDLPLRASFGAARYGAGITADAAIRDADGQLYAVKRGRSQR